MPAKTLFLIITPGLHIGVTAVAVWWTKNPEETMPHAELVGNWFVKRDIEANGMPQLVYMDRLIVSVQQEIAQQKYQDHKIFVEYFPNEVTFELAYVAKGLGSFFEFVMYRDVVKDFYGERGIPSGFQQVEDAKGLVEEIFVKEGEYEHAYIWRAVMTAVQMAKMLLIKPHPKIRRPVAPQSVPLAKDSWVYKVTALN